MTKHERQVMQAAIKRDKKIFGDKVPENIKRLVSDGIRLNQEDLKKLAKK